MTQSILIITGEASGDKHGANLVAELDQLMPDCVVSAMGGQALAASKANVIVDNRGLAVMGLVEVLRHYPQIRRALNQVKQQLQQNPPDLLVLIDYAEFNLKVAATAKKLDIPVLFYISPKFWAWREKRVNRIKQLVDMMAVIFPFEVDFYKKNSVPVRYVGNPLAGKVKATQTKADNLHDFGLDSAAPVIGIFPGSRRSEISRLLPLYLDTQQQLQSDYPNAQYILPLAPGIDKQNLESWAQRELPTNLRLIESDRVYDAMQCCDAAMVTMGTVTLEAALMEMPMLTANKIAGVSYQILSRMVTIKHLTLPNIVAEEEIVREFLQHEATVENFSNEIIKLLSDQKYRQKIVENLGRVKQKIGTENGSAKVAELIVEMLSTS